MKRIVSLDFMRGVAILSMLMFHVLLHVYDMEWTDDIFSATLPMMIFGIFIFIISQFRALFLIVSMSVHTYVMSKSLQRGVSRNEMLKKQLFMGTMLYLIGLFCEGIAANWGVFGRSLMYRTWRWDQINHILHFETLNSVALCIIIVSIAYYFLTANGGINKTKRNIIVLAMLSIIIIAVAPILQNFVDVVLYNGQYYEGLDEQYAFNSVGEFFLKLVLAALVGLEQPLFPFLASAFFGMIIGILLSQEKPPQKMIPYGKLAGLGLIIAGGLSLVFGSSGFSLSFNVHPTWLYLITNGLEIIIIMFILGKVEFNPKMDMEKFKKRTLFFRRWGMISLSLFVWQIVEFIPRDFFTWFFNLFDLGVDFHTRGQMNGYWTIFMIIVVVIFWDLIIRLWEKLKFKGSFEWGMSNIATLLLKGKKAMRESPPDRMNIEGVLYNPEPILFFKSNPETIIISQEKSIPKE